MPTYIIKGQRVSADSPLSDEEIDEIAGTLPDESASPAGGDVAKGLAAEVAIGAASQAVGAATGPGYIPIAFAGGVAGNIAAQEIEGAEDISWGRALVAGAVNLIPASKVLQGIGKGTVITKQLIAASAKDQAFKGAVIGTTDTAARAMIDEDRMPTPEELLTGGLGGTLFGGSLGAVSPKISKSVSSMFASKAGKKIEGKSEEEINEMVRKGIITPEDLSELTDIPVSQISNKIVKGTEAKEVNEAAKVLSKDSSLSWFQETFAEHIPSRTTGREVQDEIIKYTNLTKANLALGSRMERGIAKAIKDNPTVEPKIDTFLDTGVLDKSLKGTTLAANLEKYSEFRAKHQALLIEQLDDNVFLKLDQEGKEHLISQIKASMKDKNYNTREYRMFTDSEYKPSATLKAKAVNELTSKFVQKPGVDGEKAKVMAEKHIQSLVDDSAAVREAGGKGSGSALEGIFRKRGDVGPEERAFLGEITEAGERVRGTVESLTKIVNRNASDIAISKSLSKSGLATTENIPEGWMPLILRGNLDTGLHVPPAINKALGESYLHKARHQPDNIVLAALQDYWFAGVGASKAVKVLFNPPSYAVNAYGGAATMLGMGIIPKRAYFKGLKLALAEYGVVEDLASGISKKGRAALLQDMHDMERFGIANANILASDIRDTLDRGKVSGALAEGLTPVGKLYSATDTAARYQVWVHNRVVAKNLYPGISDEAAKQLSAKLTNDTFQNYDKLNSTLKTLSRIGIMPQFASFTMEFARNITNQVRYAKQMMMGTFGKDLGVTIKPNLTAMRLEGAKRLASLTAVVGATEAGRRSWNDSQGVDEDKEKLLVNLVAAPWDKDKSLGFKMNKDGESGEYMNLSYLSPHAMVADMINAGMGDNPTGDIVGSLSEYFIGEGSFVGQSIARGLANRDEYGRPISSSPDKLINTRKRVAHTLYTILEPGAFREFEKGLSPEYTKEEIALRQAGLRANKFNIEESTVQTVKSSIFAGRDSFREFNSLRNKGIASPIAMDKAYKEASSVYTDNMKRILVNIDSMRGLGWNDDRVIGVLKEAGMKGPDILAMLEERINIPDPDKEPTTADIFAARGLDTATSKEASQVIKDVAKGDMNLALSLKKKYIANRKAKASGVSAYDTVVKGLTLEERADYAIKNSDKLNELIKKGIVTKAVMIKMKEKGYNSSRY